MIWLQFGKLSSYNTHKSYPAKSKSNHIISYQTISYDIRAEHIIYDGIKSYLNIVFTSDHIKPYLISYLSKKKRRILNQYKLHEFGMRILGIPDENMQKNDSQIKERLLNNDVLLGSLVEPAM